jgi:hypothetical protein
MSMLRRLGALLAAALFCVAASSAATFDPGLAGWTSGQDYDRLYDPAHEVYVKATVIRVEHFVPRPGMAEGVRALIAVGPESLWVHLGPAVFVDTQGLKLAAGDLAVVVGAHVMVDGTATILAQRVEKAGATLKLRDRNGHPAWTGFHRRPPA